MGFKSRSKVCATSSAREERGAVLVVTLIVLLLVTLVTFAAARSSTVNMRIAVTQEVSSATFQTAESVLRRLAERDRSTYPACTTPAAPVAAFLPPLQLQIRGGETATSADDVLIEGRGVINFRRVAPSGSITKGKSGFQLYHYDNVAVATAGADGLANPVTGLTQGVFIRVPSQASGTGVDPCI